MPLQNRPTQNAAIGWNGSNATFSQYAYPGGLVCVGRDNYNAQVFRNISAAGGTVLVYLDAVIDNPYGWYHQKLHLASEFGPATTRWPGNFRANEWGYRLQGRVDPAAEAGGCAGTDRGREPAHRRILRRRRGLSIVVCRGAMEQGVDRRQTGLPERRHRAVPHISTRLQPA